MSAAIFLASLRYSVHMNRKYVSLVRYKKTQIYALLNRASSLLYFLGERWFPFHDSSDICFINQVGQNKQIFLNILSIKLYNRIVLFFETPVLLIFASYIPTLNSHAKRSYQLHNKEIQRANFIKHKNYVRVAALTGLKSILAPFAIENWATSLRQKPAIKM